MVMRLKRLIQYPGEHVWLEMTRSDYENWVSVIGHVLNTENILQPAEHSKIAPPAPGPIRRIKGVGDAT